MLIKVKNSSDIPEEFVCNGNKVINSKDIANGFNDFFVNIGPKLANKIEKPNNACIYDYMGSKNCNTIFLEVVTSQELGTIVNKLKNKTSFDADGVNMSVVKNIYHVIADPLTFICNLSLTSGVFPDKMKIAKVIPLFKSGDKNVYTNYRPVSLLPQFSKVLEKVFSKRLNNFLEKYELLSNSQYGFRNKRSTSQALLHLTEKLTKSLDNKSITVGVFIDLKKAFDTIDHSLVLNKLEYYGIRGVTLNWLQSYLSNRKQFVTVNGIESKNLNVKCGVPQGSILGPILFILYINDICNCSKIMNFILFADDTNSFLTGSDVNELCVKVTSELEKLKIWFRLNKLSLNVSKTNFMIFCKKKIQTNCSIYFDGERIERVSETKFLGIIIDDKLSWKNHVSYLCKKLQKSMGILRKVKYLLKSSTLLTLYNSLFLPYMMYCCEVWGKAVNVCINKIVVLQKKVIRIVNKCKWDEHTSPIFKRLKLLKFKDIVNLSISVILYKAKHNMLPRNLQDEFIIKNNSCKTRQCGKFYVKYRRANLKANTPSIYGVSLFNSLPIDIINSASLSQFKKLVKNYFLEKYEY